MQRRYMDDSDLEAALGAELDDAASFIDMEVGPERALATKFYRGDKFGDEEQGRSQVVMPLVRDVARATLPSLVRIFCGAQRVVEFASGAVGKDEFAEDATETVNYVLMRQNEGFKILWSAFKDALVRKTGFIKWWWDDSITVTTKQFTGVSDEQLYATNQELESYETLEIVDKSQVGTDSVTVGMDPNTQQPIEQEVPVFEYSINIVCHKRANKVCVAAVPPEEIIFTRDATDEHACRLIAHRTKKTRSELFAMGVPEEVLDKCDWEATTLDTNLERLERTPANLMKTGAASLTDDQMSTLFIEAFYRVDYDLDQISELRRVWTVGGKHKVVRNDPADEVPISLFCPDPEPHTILGMSQADNVMDLQVIVSHIWRDMLDSLKASIFPRTTYVEGQVNADDVLNTEIGAAIRMRQPGMVATLDLPYVGEKAYGMIEMLEGVKEQRTGVGRASVSLDAATLQSTNQVAVNAVVSASQAQVELIARLFAETGMKRMFRGILRLLTQHQDQKMQWRLNGHAFAVNPGDWDPDMDVIVDTGLGTGQVEQKIGVLNAVAASQTLALDKLGMDNPLCSLQELYNTQRAILQLAGLPAVHRFFHDPARAAAAGKTIKEPGPSPEQILAQAQLEIEKAKVEHANLAELLKDDRERDKMEIEAILEALKIKAQYHMNVDVEALKGLMAVKRVERQAAAKPAPVAEGA